MAWRVPSLLLVFMVCANLCSAQEESDRSQASAEVRIEAPTDAASATAEPPADMVNELTLLMMVEQGGVILWIILGLATLAIVMALYMLLTVTSRREAPPTLVKRAHKQLSAGELRETYKMVEDRDELLANVLRAGLKAAGRERLQIQEAMESEGERGAAALWQRIVYLHNIATLSTLLGLLGTVWGMMQAFSSIAFDSAQVKGISMAFSVSQAMITTAAGLAVAIPAMAIYFLLRGRVVKIIATIEGHASEFVELIIEGAEE